jgi:hypothetical protein
MRRILGRLIPLICGCLLCGAAAAAETAPRAVLTEADVEFAPVVEGTAVKHDFVVRNTGDAPLIFGTIKSG